MFDLAQLVYEIPGNLLLPETQKALATVRLLEPFYLESNLINAGKCVAPPFLPEYNNPIDCILSFNMTMGAILT